jgi:hypothetical protein
MKRFIACAVPILAAALLLCGCLNIKTTVKVKKDGSGQITQVFLLSSALSGMMNSEASTDFDTESGEGEAVSEEEEAPASSDARSDMIDKDKLAEHAKEMGEGVELVSVEPYTEGDFSGYRAVYSFKDINKLKMNQNPAELMPSDAVGGVAQQTEKELISFSFKKGSPSALTINMPPIDEKNAKKQKSKADAEEMDQATLEMMKEFYKDMRIIMDVEVEGSITDTNAQYKQGAVITLMDLDFNAILADDKLFTSLSNSKVDTLEQMKALVKGVKGLKIELARSINIKFK